MDIFPGIFIRPYYWQIKLNILKFYLYSNMSLFSEYLWYLLEDIV